MQKVSIITPCYNAEDFILRTYKSLNDQTYSNWQWVITDDCSTDNSLEILKKLEKEDFRVKVIQNEKNQGAAVSRNNSLNNADGEFVAFLDCDDLWKKDKLEKQIEFMTKNALSFSYHSYDMIDNEDKLIKKVYPRLSTNISELLKFNPFATSSVMIRKSLIDEFSIRFKEHLRRRQDYLFWYDVLVRAGEAKGIKDILSSYRIVGETSLSANKKKMALIQWQLYRKEFHLTPIVAAYYFLHYAMHGVKKYFL